MLITCLFFMNKNQRPKQRVHFSVRDAHRFNNDILTLSLAFFMPNRSEIFLKFNCQKALFFYCIFKFLGGL
jgi:hypothetical protein